jgi:hypothetical protein
MSDCNNKVGQDMPLQTLTDVCRFIKDRKIDTIQPLILGISGGEIFEHSEIIECLDIIYGYFGSNKNIGFILATNGRILSETPEYLDYIKTIKSKYGKQKTMIQVTDDERFYPTKLTEKQRYRLERIGAIIEGVPGSKEDRNRCLYPQGRALQNFNENYWNTNAPKCVNCRLLPHQGINTFKDLVQVMSNGMKNCTPTISPLGKIKLGESRLCPAVATIYDSDAEIFDKIRNFKCSNCQESIRIFNESNPYLRELLKYSMEE